MGADTFQLKRGSTAAVNAYLPAIGEPVYNTTTKALTIGDGVTLGGVTPPLTNANLSALAALVGAANKGIMFTGVGAMATYDLSPLGVSLLAGTTTQAQRTTLGIPWAGATSSTAAVDLNTIADTSILGVTSGTLNMPAGFTSGSMVTTKVFNSTSMTQVIEARASDLMSYRRNVAGVWQNWAPIAFGGANSTITSLTGLTTPLSAAQGGTGNTNGSAATLTTTRSISATGDASWTVNFNGSANATAALTLATVATPATYDQVIVNAKGLVTGGVATTAFTNVTLVNGWTVVAAKRAAYRKVGDSLQLTVNISGGTATDTTTLFTLPAGFIPPFNPSVNVLSSPNVAITPNSVLVPYITINSTTGAVTCTNCSSAAGIFFHVTLPLV